MTRRSRRPAIVVLAVVLAVLAACGGAPAAPSPTAVASPAALASGSPAPLTPSHSPSSPPSASPAATPQPAETPQPTVEPDPTPTRAPDEAWEGNARRALLGHIRADVRDTCRTVAAESDAILAKVRCPRPEPGIAAVTLRLFASRWQLLDAYWAEIGSRGIETMSHEGRCARQRATEGGYVPGDGHGIEVADRQACWLAADGTAHFLATIPSFVTVEVDAEPGTTIEDLRMYAWRGNRDAPGGPTLWTGRR